MDQRPTLNKREQILLKAARRLKDYDQKFGDPGVVASCAGQLQRTFLNYALRSSRSLTAAEHSAVDAALHSIARIACGPVVHEDNYVKAGVFLAIAGEVAAKDTAEAGPVVPSPQAPEPAGEAEVHAVRAEAEDSAGGALGSLLKPSDLEEHGEGSD